jgi:hypothetical protein
MTSERINLAIGIGGFLAGLFGVIVSWWSIRTAWRIAHEAGSLKRSSLKFQYGPLDLRPSGHLEIVYALPKAQPPSLGALRILVSNTGTRAAESTKVEIVLPAEVNSAAEVLSFKVERGSMPGLQRTVSRADKLLYTYHHLPMLYASESIAIEEWFWCAPTVGSPFSYKVKTADAKTVRVEGTITYAFVFNLVLFPKEEPPSPGRIHLSCVEADNVNELLERWLPYEKQRVQKKPWIAHLLKLNTEERATLLVVPCFKETLFGDGSRIPVENFSDSERWWLQRTKRGWNVTPVHWVFTQGIGTEGSR